MSEKNSHRPPSVQRRAASRPAAGPPGQRSLWILGPWWDLALFVGTPLLIVPALLAAQWRFRPDDVYLVVASFGALGHHLPGMMRAYGDRFLFQRFKYRFLLAPLLLGTTCVLFAVRELNGIVLIVYLWGVWHGLMQTYGFLRIYDAKVGSISRLTARLDSAMCIAWFGAAVLLSPSRMTKILADYYGAGGLAVSPSLVETVTDVWIMGTATVTLVFLGHLLRHWTRGARPSPVKLCLMASSFAFWWYSNVAVTNMLVGIALFEVFHDVQYLSIVWIFNLNRVSRNPDVGRFTRLLFRRSGALVGVYVGLVAAYGSLNIVQRVLPSQTLTQALTGLLAASALLHFYYDGFIWKVREPSTRESLGLGRTNAAPIEPSSAKPWVHGLKWAPFFLAVAWLASAQGRGTLPELDRHQLIAAAVPASAEAQNNLGVALLMRGRADEGEQRLQEALRLRPDYAEAHSNVGLALAKQGQAAQAAAHYREALRLDPRQLQTYSNLGNILVQQGRLPEAIELFEKGLRLDPDDPQAHTNLAGALLRQGRPEQAIAHLQNALRADPTFQPARHNLEIALRNQAVR